ncbi:MAG TPA: endopeptidase La [bacterium]|nr:endopeptidase La [bacterium]
MSEIQLYDDMKEIPDIMPVVPVSGTMIYPFMVVPFLVQGEKNEKAIDVAMAGDHFILAVSIKDIKQGDKDPRPDNLYRVGTVSSVLRMMRVPSGGIKIMAQGLFRGKAAGFEIKEDGYISAAVQIINEKKIELAPGILALMRNVRDQLDRAVHLGKSLPPEFITMIRNLKEPGKLADLVSSVMETETGDAQNILEQLDPEKRLEFVSRLISNELEILEIQNRIKSNVQSEMEDTQKKYFLKEQLKAIQKELGQDDPRSSEIKELKRAIQESEMPVEAREQTVAELERLERMHPDAAEANVIRTYIDWMIKLPWNKSTKDRLDLNHARKVLDQDHYGLDKIKTRIVESLAVKKLNPESRSPILCFVGPPGVGKTSLGHSIARALNRKFIRLSVGGVRDEAEIRGHRRTYVGALPGRIINGIKNAGSINPVFMIDEVDKIGADYRGDPSSALLEVLDPEQNSTFVDHYLDVPFDLSKIMFITTANVLDTIPAPLLDRMEVIQIAGYTEEEKMAIAGRYLVPRQIEGNGLKSSQLKFSQSSLRSIIRGHTREAGVRNLEREIGGVCRKVAAKVARGSRKNFNISAADVKTYLGPPRVYSGVQGRRNQIGVVNGLAWTPTGGEVLIIEAALMEGKGQLILTGQLGDVMKESTQAALGYSRILGSRMEFKEKFSDKYDLHVHVPAGAVPKDGPSAGIAMFTALLSLFLQKPVRKDIAMTGEISLRGTVLPIGGLKQKLLAARRERIKTVFVPETNRNDIEDIKKEDLSGLEIIYVKTADELLDKVFVEKKTRSKSKSES